MHSDCTNHVILHVARGAHGDRAGCHPYVLADPFLSWVVDKTTSRILYYCKRGWVGGK